MVSWPSGAPGSAGVTTRPRSWTTTRSRRCVLVHGRRSNFESSLRRQEKRAELARPDERLMSFDRLSPARCSVLYSTVRKGQDGYRVTSVPPGLTIFNTGEVYRQVSGWGEALDGC